MKQTVEKKEIYYLTVKNSGPWVTLINGHARTHLDFKNLSKKLEAAGFSVLLLDNRGCGKSFTQEDFTIDDMADDVESLWSKLGIQESYLLGISMGGLIAQRIAITSRVPKALVLTSTTASQHHYRIPFFEWAPSLDLVREQLRPYFAPIFYEKNALLVTAMAKQLLSSEDSDQKAQIMRQRKAIQIFKFEEIDPSLIKIPTLVIHGEKDGVISVEAAIDIASRINGSLRHIYPDTGHLILAEKPSEFYSDVISFFTSQNG
jgi:pimeloyl-ACP methyl ester carboxylesterase